MWHDIDKIPLSEDHYENFFYWPLLDWISYNFNRNRDPQNNLIVLKPTRVREGRVYHSDLAIYGEFPFLLQYKAPKYLRNSNSILKYELNERQHNKLVDIARIYTGVFVCYALPIIRQDHLRFHSPSYPFWPYRFTHDLENYLYFVDVATLQNQTGRHHIEINTLNSRLTATMHSEPHEVTLLSAKDWLLKLKKTRKEQGKGGRLLNEIKKSYSSLGRKMNLMVDFDYRD